MKRVIVTGGTGVTGNALVRTLLSQGIMVTSIIRPNSPRKKWLPCEDSRLKIMECDLKDLQQLQEQLKEHTYDAFFHLAWEGSRGTNKTNKRNDMYMQTKNISFELNAVELCKSISCPVFVATGTQAEYGKKTEIISENTSCEPENGYGAAKYCAGIMTRKLCEEYGIRHIWARLFSVYGPYDGTHSLIDTTIKALMADEEPEFTAGEQEWDYLYSYDAAKALILLAQKGRDGEIYCVANGNSRPLKEYIYELFGAMGRENVPGIGKIPYAPGQVMFLKTDISKIKKDTGFFPETEFKNGIKSVVDWYAETKRK